MTKRMLMVDSGCEPTPELVDKYGLAVMGMKVTLDHQDFWDFKELRQEQYYEQIPHINEFHTNPPTLWDIFDTYEEIRDKGYEQLVGIHMSAKVSQTFNICNRAKKLVNGFDVQVFDTASVSAGAYLIADKILELLEQGKSFEEINALLPSIRESTFVQFSVPTVKYLMKNGRIGKAQAFAALMLQIKPILGVKDGMVVPLSKEKGLEKALKRMADNAFKFIKKRPHNVKIALGYGLDSCRPYMESLQTMFMEKFEKLNIQKYETGIGRVMPTVACHSGPDVFGLGVYGEKKPIE